MGVYHGKSLVLLSLLKNQDEKLIGFDLFDADHEERTRDNLNHFGSSEQSLWCAATPARLRKLT